MATIRTRKTADKIDPDTGKVKKGKNRYRVVIRLQGHPEVSKTFKRLTDAKQWASQTETDIARGQYFEHLEAEKHTFKEMVDRYI